MATLTFTTTAAQDAALSYYTTQWNTRTGDTLTPRDFLIARLGAWLDDWVARATNERRETKGQAYQKATPEDQAAVDAILAKYQ